MRARGFTFKRFAGPIVLGAMALVALAPAAHAVVAAAGPGASFGGYATRVVVVPRGGPLTFVNGDLADHTLTSEARLPRRIAKKTPHCKAYGARSCPVFTSPVVPGGESGAVQGLNRVKPGRDYEFMCMIHSGMRGTLIVGGAATAGK